MTFIKLKTPNTDNYKAVKEFVLGNQIPWYWFSSNCPTDNGNSQWNNTGGYGLCILSRPADPSQRLVSESGDVPLFPLPQSEHLPLITDMIHDILKANPSLPFNYIHRISINCTHFPGFENDKISVPHRDHEFPHKNMLIYFTDSGGGTHITDAYGNILETHEPQEDDIVVFEGWHAMHMPKKGRRIVCVVTFS